jgi:hypothetical protein
MPGAGASESVQFSCPFTFHFSRYYQFSECLPLRWPSLLTAYYVQFQLVAFKKELDMKETSWGKIRLFLFRWFFTFLNGVTFGDWLRLLRENRFAIDVPYWPRAAFITLNSLSNSLTRQLENGLHGAAIASQKIQSPLFVLGHWRAGTTHLHNLLAVDRQFAFPNNYQVCYPHTFLLTEALNSHLGFLLPDHRPQDNVRLALTEPQEDEFALCVSTLLSPYTGWFFPSREASYDRYLTFRSASEEERSRWKSAFTTFLKKLTLKYQRPLLLKSPPHTCRIKLLLEMFPRARFIHICRNPYTVYQSTQKLYETTIRANSLQVWEKGRSEEQILQTYRVMYDAFLEEKTLIPTGQFHELSFEQLEKDPIGQLRHVYEALNIPGFDGVEPSLRLYVESLTGYRKNEYGELPRDLRQRIARAWSRYFEEWGYSY